MGRAIILLAAVAAVVGCGTPDPTPVPVGTKGTTNKGTVQSGGRSLTPAGQNADSRVGSRVGR